MSCYKGETPQHHGALDGLSWGIVPTHQCPDETGSPCYAISCPAHSEIESSPV
jgi:hypothetical protein